ncbi:hypothetical protein PM082_012435 [Marasmius tenuissimus]|nr:hypothetical protein PM082_012435 [Marasmius tenuissimus]
MVLKGNRGCSLPLELISKILSTCSPKTRVICSLVCRSWLPICRSYSFGGRGLEIDNPNACENFLSLLTSGTECSIIGHISEAHFALDQKLLKIDKEILQARSNTSTHHSKKHLRNATLYTENIRSLLSRLAEKAIMLSSLSLKTSSSYNPVPNIFSPQFNLMPSLTISSSTITSLTFHGSSEDVRDVIQFICSFPHLVALSTHSECLSTLRRPKAPQPSSRLPETLRTLILSSRTAPLESENERYIWEQWIVKHPPLPKLDSFSIYSFAIWRSQGDDIAIFLNGPCNRATLKSLYTSFSIETANCDLEALTKKSFNLSDLPSLRTFGIIFPEVYHRSYRTHGRFVDTVWYIVSTIRETSRNFESLEFTMVHQVLGKTWMSEFCNPLDHTIAELPMKPRLCISVPCSAEDGPDHESMCLEMAKKVFPRCYENNRLVVRLGPVSLNFPAEYI